GGTLFRKSSKPTQLDKDNLNNFTQFGNKISISTKNNTTTNRDSITTKAKGNANLSYKTNNQDTLSLQSHPMVLPVRKDMDVIDYASVNLITMSEQADAEDNGNLDRRENENKPVITFENKEIVINSESPLKTSLYGRTLSMRESKFGNEFEK